MTTTNLPARRTVTTVAAPQAVKTSQTPAQPRKERSLAYYLGLLLLVCAAGAVAGLMLNLLTI